MPLSYRRKPESQVKRDRDRAARHRANTSSNDGAVDGAGDHVTPPILINSVENATSETDPASPVSSVDPAVGIVPGLVPSAESFDHDQSPVDDGGTKLNDTTPLVFNNSAAQSVPSTIYSSVSTDDSNNQDTISCYECGTSAPVTLSLFGCDMLQCDECNKYYVCGVCVNLPKKRHIFKCESRLKYLST